MNVKKIVENWLKENGYTGLYNEAGICGCEIDDLMPCAGADNWNSIDDCMPGFKTVCGEKCQWYEDNCEELCENDRNGWFIQKEKVE
ncbi:MAG: hypothetical protein WDA59_05480 [Methanofastidiosum sp.]